MKKVKFFVLVIMSFFLLIIVWSRIHALAQTTGSFRSNTITTKVGEPSEPRPGIGNNIAASCPVPNGKISTHSYTADPKTGHCSPGYSLEGRCRADCPGGIGASRRANAIDVPTKGGDVILPTLENQTVQWTEIQTYPVDLADGGGNGVTFQAPSGSDIWTLDMLHMGSINLKQGQSYPSGTAIGKTAIDHVHMTIGKNIKNNTSEGQAVTDCDAGWIPSDFMCQ